MALNAQAHSSDRIAGASGPVLITLISFVIVMIDGYDSLIVSFIAPLVAHEWRLRPIDIGNIFAIGYVGAVIGAIALGRMADRLGRKPVLLAALVLAAVGTGLSGAATSYPMLLALRLITGVALGGVLPAVISITAEHAKPERRHAMVTLMYIGFPLGAVVGGGVTAALIHLGWRSIFFGAAAACLMALGVALLLSDPFKRASPGVSATIKARAGGFTEQFADGRLWPALTLWLGLFCVLLLTNFLVGWTPSILVARGGSPRMAVIGGLLLNLGGIAGAVLSGPLVRRFGAYKPVAAIFGVGAILVALLGQNVGSVPFTLAILFLAGACIIGGQLNFPAMTAELFPPHVRGVGSGWTIGVGRLGSIVGPVIGGALIGAHLEGGRLFLIAAVPALASAAALLGAALLKPSLR